MLIVREVVGANQLFWTAKSYFKNQIYLYEHERTFVLQQINRFFFKQNLQYDMFLKMCIHY